MEFVTEYLQSTRMAQDLNQIADCKPNNLEYLNQEMTCAMLRWKQWFENTYVDYEQTKQRPATQQDFNQFRLGMLQILSDEKIDEAAIIPKIDQLLLNTAQSFLVPGNDYKQRLATLMTMGACEYHGFNSYFTDSIKQHGLDSRYQNNPHLEPIYKIFKRVGADTQLGRFKNDQKIYVTPNPRVAYLHSKVTPKWFSYLNDKVCQPYVNQDYDEALNNLFKFNGSKKLTANEISTITTFFNQWWKKLVTPNRQKIAIMPYYRDPKILQSKIKINQAYIEKFGAERLLHGPMYYTYENVYNQPIKPEWLQIIDIPNQITHQQKLSQLQNSFQENNLKQMVQNQNQLTTA